ncbi:MAG TPA: Ig-like domain-containing protein, partial [Nitrospiria bacterium]
TTGTKDAAGNALAADYVWSFTSGATPDTTPPTVSSTSPVSGETEVTVISTISAVFSETMDASTLTTATFTLGSGAGPVAGTVDYIGTTATFTPSALLTGDTTYTATITAGVKDAAGNALSADAVWSFTTAVPQWQGDPPDTPLNFDPGLNAGETQNASDGSRIAAAWMEKDTVSGVYRGYVKQRSLTGTGWNLLGGSLNIDPAHNVYEPFLAYHQGNLWVAWNECRDGIGVPHVDCAVSNIYARYWDGSQWVDPAVPPTVPQTPLNRDPNKNGLIGFLRSDGNDLYLVWEEEGAFQIKQVYVKQWGGSSWVDLGGSLNIDTTHNVEEPILDVVEGRPYVIWTEEASSGNYLVYVKHWDGGSWVQDGGSLNISSSQTAIYPSIVNHGEIPYAAWHERVSVGGTPVYRLFVKHLSAGSWVLDADAGPGGTLNIDSGMNTSNLRMASAGTRLYIVWVEANASGINQVYVKRFEAGAWSAVPGEGAGGSLNNNVTHSAHEVAITNVGTAVLVVWDEDNGAGVNQVYWKVYY